MLRTNNLELKVKNTSTNTKNTNVKERSYLFYLEIIKFIGSLPNRGIFLILNNQLLRSAISIGANIIEAQTGRSRKDFIKFYQIALKSTNETIYCLSLFKDALPEDYLKLKVLIQEASEIGKMLGKSLITLKAK